ncbi:MAG TPA: phage tail protein [Halomonas sp.]|jgi:anion-transporting  ArsA/GET3 family ATPase|nr:phage tail protein [Halomonas sp.]
MANTPEQLAEVRQAIVDLATGKRVVSINQNGRQVQFAQADLPALQSLENQIAERLQALSKRRRSRTRLVMTNKGL